MTVNRKCYRHAVPKKIRAMKLNVISFPDYFRECHEDPDRRVWIEAYEEKYGISQDTPLEEHPFYKEYLSKFNPHYAMTIETADFPVIHVSHYDDPTCRGLNLLFRLIFGSLSMKYSLSLSDEWKEKPGPVIQTKLQIVVEKEDREPLVIPFEKLSVQSIKKLFEVCMKEMIDYYLIDVPTEIQKLHDQQREKLKWYWEVSCWPLFDVTEAYKAVLKLYLES